MSIVKRTIEGEKNNYSAGIVSDKVKDRSNDPYFIKKAEDAKEFLRKKGLNGLPDQPGK